MAFIAQKRSGIGAALAGEIADFNNLCDENDLEQLNVCVTDDEHEVLSLDSNVPFISSENGKLYNTVMEAYNEIIMENIVMQVDSKEITEFNYGIMFVLLSDKFNNNIEANQVLMSTTEQIVYKTDNDNLWGSKVPEFDGQNIAGQIMTDLRRRGDPFDPQTPFF